MGNFFLQARNNLSDVANAATALANLGGGGGGADVISALGTVTTALAVDLAAGSVFTATLGGSPTATFTGAVSGVSCAFDLYLTQDGTGGRTVTWPGSVTWIGGTAPVLNAGPNALTVLTFDTLNGGTTWYGSQVTAGPSLPLSVGNGGLGVSTLTACGIIAGGTTTTGPAQQIGLGTAGQVLTSNGAGALPTMQAAGGGAGGVTTAGLGLALAGCAPWAAASDSNISAEQMFAVLCTATQANTITTLGTALVQAGVTAGTGVNQLGLYTEAGALVAQTGDMTAAFGATGYAEGAIANPGGITSYTLAQGANYYLAMLSNFTGTVPKPAGAITITNGLTVVPLNGHYLCRFLSTQTSMPSSITPSAMPALTFLPFIYAR